MRAMSAQEMQEVGGRDSSGEAIPLVDITEGAPSDTFQALIAVLVNSEASDRISVGLSRVMSRHGALTLYSSIEWALSDPYSRGCEPISFGPW